MKYLRYLIIILCFVFVLTPSLVNAICEIYTGIEPAEIGPYSQKLMDIIDKIATLLLVIGIGASILVIIIGGIKYMTSGGDEKKAGDARKFVTYGVIGFIVVVAAQFLICLLAEFLANLYT